jgi:hypothetical protein
MSGHTPGPWVVTSADWPDDETGVVRYYVRHEPSNISAPNARLIEAAPDLLQCLHETSDALRALVYACETEGWTGQQALAMWKFAMAHNADLEDRVNAAIAKAEGR